jgi:peptidylprolyl isomerase
VNLLRPRHFAAAAAAIVLIASLAGCSSSGKGSNNYLDGNGNSPGTSASPTPGGVIPTATAGGAVVPYAGTVGTGVGVVGKTQHEPKVTIAKGAPKPTALITTDLVIGTGATATATSKVSVSYVGVNFLTGKVFNNTYPTGQTLTIGLDQVIDGWKQGIPGMKVGGVRALSMPASLAYGDSPPDASVAGPLVFVVELQSMS